MNIERLWKPAVRTICSIIGGFIVIYGLRELRSGRWTGSICVLIGPVFPYMANREGWQKRAEKDQLSRKA